MPETATTSDVAEIDVAAAPEAVWDMVSDITQMGRWSPECDRCRWLDGGTGPREGARFKGWNRQALGPIPIRWSTVSTVVEAQRGEVFSFFTKDSGATWTYRFESRDDGTHLVETREQGKKPLMARAFGAVMPGRAELQRDGMAETVRRIKAVAEA
ncbi:SRPBCC family protein [soil metagenome]